MNIKKIILYLLEWLLPSCTVFYLIISKYIIMGTYNIFGLSLNVPSYILASLLGAGMFYYLNKYIFRSEHKEINITINGSPHIVHEGDTIIIQEASNGK
jgi:hypothetical protein